MRFLSLVQFQNHLAISKDDFESYKTFLHKAQVRLWNGSLKPLAEYRKEHTHITSTDLKNVYNHILNQSDYITNVYNTSLRVGPENILTSDIKPMFINAINNSTSPQYKNIVRNMFWREILRDTQTERNDKTYLTVLEDLYKHNIINHKLLAPTVLGYLAKGPIGRILAFYYFRASIMNPYVVYSLQMRIFKSRRVFTPTLGWGSYFHGFVAGGVEEYVGVDVIPNVCDKVARYANEYHPTIKTQIICQPSESLLQSNSFMRNYAGHFDTVFFSPPYFRLELYPGGKQSTTEYPTYESWLNGYWRNTVQVCMHVLSKGGTMCYILGNYGDGHGTEYPLVEDMGKIAREEGFTYKRTIPMLNRGTPDEKITFFVK
jgi:hypothetical protein